MNTESRITKGCVRGATRCVEVGRARQKEGDAQGMAGHKQEMTKGTPRECKQRFASERAHASKSRTSTSAADKQSPGKKQSSRDHLIVTEGK